MNERVFASYIGTGFTLPQGGKYLYVSSDVVDFAREVLRRANGKLNWLPAALARVERLNDALNSRNGTRNRAYDEAIKALVPIRERMRRDCVSLGWKPLGDRFSEHDFRTGTSWYTVGGKWSKCDGPTFIGQGRVTPW